MRAEIAIICYHLGGEAGPVSRTSSVRDRRRSGDTAHRGAGEHTAVTRVTRPLVIAAVKGSCRPGRRLKNAIISASGRSVTTACRARIPYTGTIEVWAVPSEKR
jgi:hypothetical protein